MYRPFLHDNIFACIEFVIFLGFYAFLMYRNFQFIKIQYIEKYTVKTKIAILIITILLNSIIYIILDMYNVNWILSIIINATFISLIVFLAISIFYQKNK